MGLPDERPAPVVESAGRSALTEAIQLGLDIDCVQRQLASLTDVLRQLRERQGSFRVGADGEQRVVRVLVDMVDTGWTVLPDRHWPGTRRANIDVLLAGPGGVFVVEVKNWRHARVERGRLWRGQSPADDTVGKLLDQVAAVRAILVDEGLAPAEVVPLLVLTGRRDTRARLGAIEVLGEHDLSMDLLRRGTRLTAAQVEQVVTTLESACPPATGSATFPRPRPAHEGTARSPAAPTAAPPLGRSLAGGAATVEVAPSETGKPTSGLLDLEQVWARLVEAAAAEPIESWMTWLHPSQARLITRTWNGPARIRGPAGTGKTVVALHRARHLSQHGRRVLFSAYTRNLGPVFAGLFSRLAPELSDRVDFRSVHQVAVRILRDAGLVVTVDQAALDDCWSRAWAATHHDAVLESLAHPPQYWRDEITSVIKGRGITDLAGYATLTRVGRHTPLQPVHRQAVWRLYREYERRRIERGLTDWADVLTQALHAVRTGLVEPSWDAVIVDEVQDLTCTGLQLLHALVGDRADGLLLVGDVQQAVYPGGFALTEAGISVAGRSVVLNRNYRNGADILRHALDVLGEDTFDDLDPGPGDPRRPVQPTRSGGLVVHATADDTTSQQHALLAHLTDLEHAHHARHGDIAILVATNAAARHWHRLLDRTGVPSVLLTDYDGHRVDAVKIGTFERGKGLDFAHVLIPDHDHLPLPRRHHELEDAYTERARHERRRLYVAITRARDTLWLGNTPAAAS